MSLYDALGVERGADSQEIRRAYLKLSKTAHPDKGGSEEEFKKIQQAYEVLSDDQQRAFYDQTGQIPGEDGGSGGGGPPGGMPFGFPFDFAQMFGGMGGGFGGGMFGGNRPGQRMKRPKAPPKQHEIGLTLADFYHGKSIRFKFDRQKFCDGCKGAGATSFETCSACGGEGSRQQVMMIGPGMQAVSRSPCGACGAEGKRAKQACSKCNGSKFQSQEKALHVSIEPGMKPGEVLSFARECSDHPEFEEAGDVHIILREADESSPFKRAGDDLRVVVQIGLRDALLGCKKVLQGHPGHASGLTVEVPAGTMRGDVLTISGEGMPRGPGKTGRGNLLCTVNVDVSSSERAQIVAGRGLLEQLFTPSEQTK